MIETCILKGKSTSQEQFESFMDSYINALEYRGAETLDLSYNREVNSVFMVDTEEAAQYIEKVYEKKKLNELVSEKTILRRDDDPGELRNEFLAHLQISYTDVEASRYHLVFMFFDGDDLLQREYLTFDESLVNGRGFGIMNPVSFYGDTESDYYPLKWCLRASHGDIFELALMDMVGGQCWGKVWDSPIAKECKFGRGLFEDVPFWCQATEKHRNPVMFWNRVYFWRRNNPNALTRNTPTAASIQNGIDNLNEAIEIALKHYPLDSKMVWRRYSIGVLTLFKNAARAEQSDYLVDYLKSQIKPEVFNPKFIKASEPKFWQTIIEAFPMFEAWLKNESYDL